MTRIEHKVLIRIWLRVVVILSSQLIKRFLLVVDGEVVHESDDKAHRLVISSSCSTTVTSKRFRTPSHAHTFFQITRTLHVVFGPLVNIALI